MENEYDDLENNIISMIREKQEIEDVNSSYEEKLEEIWLRELVSGKYNTEEELQEGKTDAFRESKYFATVIIDISTKFMEVDEYNQIRNTMYHIIQKLNIDNIKSL